ATLAAGTTTASAQVPSRFSPRIEYVLHRLSSPSWQASHTPHETPGRMTTSSPSFTVVTPGPSASTTPAPSLPSTRGSGKVCPGTPRRTHTSRWFTPQARTATRTSPGPGTGSGRSSNSSLSRPPCSRTTTACTRPLLAAPELGLALVDVRREALACVRAREQPGLQLAFEGQPVLERHLRAALHRALDVADGEGR